MTRLIGSGNPRGSPIKLGPVPIISWAAVLLAKLQAVIAQIWQRRWFGNKFLADGAIPNAVSAIYHDRTPACSSQGQTRLQGRVQEFENVTSLTGCLFLRLQAAGSGCLASP